MKAPSRIALLLVATIAIVGAACIIGPKHDDPADLSIPPGTDASSDTSVGPPDDTGGVADTLGGSPDVDKVPDGVADDASADAIRDAADGDVGGDAADGDAAEGGDPDARDAD